MAEVLHIGMDAGSKTVKLVVMNSSKEVLFSLYDRHLSNVKETLLYALQRTLKRYPDLSATIGITGSAGMKIAENLGISFTQEVIAAKTAIEHAAPAADVAIELGGEDSKILFLTGGEELRMNSACAGGTGGFIDTIAGMLDINAEKLNVLAHGCETIYPIASRCAVFAQSDVRPLLNEGVSKSDIAGSVFRAVAVQCVAGLACGRSIRGKIVFLGGPLYFLSVLRKHFCDVLGIAEEDTFVPPEAHLLVAQGAALSAWGEKEIDIATTIDTLSRLGIGDEQDAGRLEPLFENEQEYHDFKMRHARASIPRNRLSVYEGPVFLGIDAGSTSIKCVLIDADKQILYSYYKRSAGDLVEVAKDMLIDLYKHLPRRPDGKRTVHIVSSLCTGYGEDFLKNAFLIDSGEVETIAHMRAAQELEPSVDCILDIGGQDIKFIKVRDKMPDEVVLNEACSSGCGSLLSGFAWSFNIKMRDFVARAIKAEKPVDLGTRCTVFMTSRVRHAQKEGASLGDISAGLAYSVVKNALYKVIRVPDIERIGRTIVVQGGTFKNDAVLRAFEKLCRKNVIRPDASEYMGAYGAALLAQERKRNEGMSSLLSEEKIKKLKSKQTTFRCELCMNNCLLTANRFGDEDEGYTRTYLTGNRCERGAGNPATQSKSVNLYTYRYRRVFENPPFEGEKSPRGKIGLLRALNMFDEYPFWSTCFSRLGYEVVLSDPSSRDLYALGIESLPSESSCYPTKLAYGHAVDLIEKGVELIVAPRESHSADNCLRCPLYASYPTALEANIEAFSVGSKKLLSPYIEGLRPQKSRQIIEALTEAFERIDIKPPSATELQEAVEAGFDALQSFLQDMQEEGAKAFRSLQKSSSRGVVLAGRPYHGDPELHHAIPELLGSYGFAVFTLDSLPASELRRFDENGSRWGYVNETYRAARFVAEHDNLEMIQLYSFGCGIDAVSTDSVRDILAKAGKAFAALKIDEMCDVAAARIRIRSMLAASSARKKQASHTEPFVHVNDASKGIKPKKIYFAHWSEDTIDMMAPLFSSETTEVLPFDAGGTSMIQTALSYENNDSCFTTLVVIGQIATALQEGEIESGNTAIMAPHPCLGCISGDMNDQARKILSAFDKDDVPLYPDIVDLIDFVDRNSEEDARFADRIACGYVCNDLLNQLLNRLRPYREKTDGLFDKREVFRRMCEERLWEHPSQMDAFLKSELASSLVVTEGKERKPRIGITGLFPSVFCGAINDDLVGLLEGEGCEVVMPALSDYVLYAMIAGNRRSHFYDRLLMWRKRAAKSLKQLDEGTFPVFDSFENRQPYYLDKRDTQGMGWLFSLHVENYEAWGLRTVVFSQTFGCLPGHCLGRGIFKRIKKHCSDMNLLSIEFDPGVSGVNRENRIKLLTTLAKTKERNDGHDSYP